MNIKKSLNNPYEFVSWKPNTDCCKKWSAVNCDPKTNRVNELSWLISSSGELFGQISSSIGDLPYLETLVLRHLNITGTIPRSITKLKHLKELDLSDLSLSGPVPSFLNQLTALTYLDLSNNQFTGSIPPNLSDLEHIETIYLDANKLTGSIPESFGKFSRSMNLHLSQNQLSGQVPKSLGAVNFGAIVLSSNRLVGDASFLFNPNYGPTWYIGLSGNQFSFDLTKVKFPKGLIWFNISHNKIFGGIPEEMKLLDLQLFNVSYNNLCGKIPYGGKIQSFEASSFSHNKCLCGPPTVACRKG
ncbi:hypothetical protein MKW94_023338 [Papaver nudicaule]|uniref:Leucine-rich repeat-containing N-terminal plant-type domain-containing protein n=1 Tax=Papaver nudicaule TaxID=74823 RepID=A0AA41RJV0_PAPNU|nr:hypothetical protein [Papaver nudicaule]